MRENAIMTENPTEISLRPIKEEDITLLYEIYRSTRIDEIGIASWEYQEREDFLKMQFNMQHAQYMANYQNAEFHIIMLDNTPIGRLYVDRRKDDIRIIDIALLKEYRDRGIGTILLANLIEESEKKKVSLSIHVEYYNFAKAWYQRYGFTQEDEVGVYVFMRRLPARK